MKWKKILPVFFDHLFGEKTTRIVVVIEGRQHSRIYCQIKAELVATATNRQEQKDGTVVYISHR